MLFTLQPAAHFLQSSLNNINAHFYHRHRYFPDTCLALKSISQQQRYQHRHTPENINTTPSHSNKLPSCRSTAPTAPTTSEHLPNPISAPKSPEHSRQFELYSKTRLAVSAIPTILSPITRLNNQRSSHKPMNASASPKSSW